MPEKSDYVIRTDALTRYYGRRAVVKDLDLKVPRGCIFAFLGGNGAGKSTTIRMLLGLVEPTRGTSTVLGCDSMELTRDVRSRIGYLAEGHHVYEWMTVAECARFQRDGYAHWNNDIFHGVIDHFGLSSTARAKDLSRGERAGLCLALTLAPEPELLILDDPVLGLDTTARRSLLQAMIYVTRRAGQTVLFSSHQLGDVDRVADRIAVLDEGVLRAQCSLETFRSRVRRFWITYDGKPPEVENIPGLLHKRVDRDGMTATFANFDDERYRRLRSLSTAQVTELPLDIEEAFVQFTGRRDAPGFFSSVSEVGQ